MRTSKVVHRHRPESVRTVDDARAHAAADADDGFYFFARAFNLADSAKLRYTWDPPTRSRAEAALIELLSLLQSGRIALRAGAVAQDDGAFQKLLAEIAGLRDHPSP